MPRPKTEIRVLNQADSDNQPDNALNTASRLCWLRNIDEVAADDWDRLQCADNPFLSHAFLAALEHNGCVSGQSGWIPNHLVLFHGSELYAAMPGYIKMHSQGEFVFDWSWAEASERAGWRYYPKLISAVPHTPVTGPRFLLAADADPQVSIDLLTQECIRHAQQHNFSSVHWLFNNAEQSACMRDNEIVERWDCQFHWHNDGYSDFDDYLRALTSKRRKQVRKERREAATAPVEITLLHGAELGEAEILAYHALYSSTYDRKWGYPALSFEFFMEMAAQLPDQLILILARRDGEYVAGAHLLRGNDTLYGRNWGCHEHYRSLHFEMCYYRGIEYCIEHGLTVFEAGAQGEHKIFRGFKPVKMRSQHWIREPALRQAIVEYLQRERSDIDAYIDQMLTHQPYHQTPDDNCEAR